MAYVTEALPACNVQIKITIRITVVYLKRLWLNYLFLAQRCFLIRLDKANKNLLRRIDFIRVKWANFTFPLIVEQANRMTAKLAIFSYRFRINLLLIAFIHCYVTQYSYMPGYLLSNQNFTVNGAGHVNWLPKEYAMHERSNELMPDLPM